MNHVARQRQSPVTHHWRGRVSTLWPTGESRRVELYLSPKTTSLSLLFSSYTYIRCKSVVDLEKEKLIERKLLKSEADTRNVRAVFIGWPFICSFYLLLPFIFVVGKSMEGMQPDKSKSKLNSQPGYRMIWSFIRNRKLVSILPSKSVFHDF